MSDWSDFFTVFSVIMGGLAALFFYLWLDLKIEAWLRHRRGESP